MKRYAIISTLVAAVPAAVIAVMALGGGDAQNGKGPKTPESPPAGQAAPALPQNENGSGFTKLSSLLEKFSKEEDGTTAVVRRILEEKYLSDKNRTQLLSELAIRAGRAGLTESSEMLDAAHLAPTGQLRFALYSGVLQTRGEANPEEALKLCGVLHEEADQQAARSFVARFWAMQDMDAATRAVERLDFPEVRIAAAEGLLEAARARPEEGMKVLARKDLNAEVAMTLAPSFASAWRDSLEDLKAAVPSCRQPQVMSQLMAGYAISRPLEVLPYLAANPGVTFREDIIAEMARVTAAGNAGPALEKIQAAGEFPQRKDLIPATFSHWMSADLKGAGDWLKEKESVLEDPAMADRLKELLVYRMKSAGATESAIAWAGRISDGEKRDKVLKDLEVSKE